MVFNRSGSLLVVGSADGMIRVFGEYHTPMQECCLTVLNRIGVQGLVYKGFWWKLFGAKNSSAGAEGEISKLIMFFFVRFPAPLPPSLLLLLSLSLLSFFYSFTQTHTHAHTKWYGCTFCRCTCAIFFVFCFILTNPMTRLRLMWHRTISIFSSVYLSSVYPHQTWTPMTVWSAGMDIWVRSTPSASAMMRTQSTALALMERWAGLEKTWFSSLFFYIWGEIECSIVKKVGKRERERERGGGGSLKGWAKMWVRQNWGNSLSWVLWRMPIAWDLTNAVGWLWHSFSKKYWSSHKPDVCSHMWFPRLLLFSSISGASVKLPRSSAKSRWTRLPLPGSSWPFRRETQPALRTRASSGWTRKANMCWRLPAHRVLFTRYGAPCLLHGLVFVAMQFAVVCCQGLIVFNNSCWGLSLSLSLSSLVFSLSLSLSLSNPAWRRRESKWHRSPARCHASLPRLPGPWRGLEHCPQLWHMSNICTRWFHLCQHFTEEMRTLSPNNTHPYSWNTYQSIPVPWVHTQPDSTVHFRKFWPVCSSSSNGFFWLFSFSLLFGARSILYSCIQLRFWFSRSVHSCCAAV